MKRLIALTLALTLVTVGLPVLAHPAEHPEECKNRSGRDRCTESYAAHHACEGVRNHMSSDESTIVRESLSPGDADESTVKGYVHVSKERTATETSGDTASLMPGLVWIETNGFEGLQRTDWKCSSPDEPRNFEVHADQVLI